jgi:LPS sulfotransferase NodH
MSKKFVIVGAARTGSTLLVRTLNSLEGVCCHGELLADLVRGYQNGFNPLEASKSERDDRANRLLQQRNQDPRGFILKALNTESPATGFKALYSNLSDPRWRDVTQSLLEMPDFKFIHLTRRNSLRRFVSEQILQSGGPNHSGAGGKSENWIKVHIDIDAYLRSTADVEAVCRQFISLLAKKELLTITYEQLSTDTAVTVTAVCQFLGLDTLPSGIKPALKKVGAADLRDSVSNYQDLLDNPATRDLALAD